MCDHLLIVEGPGPALTGPLLTAPAPYSGSAANRDGSSQHSAVRPFARSPMHQSSASSHVGNSRCRRRVRDFLDSASHRGAATSGQGARRQGEIGIASVRAGDVVGTHTVWFAGAGERIQVTHEATDRAIFARGALRAAAWLAPQKPGRYSMANVLGLKTTS